MLIGEIRALLYMLYLFIRVSLMSLQLLEPKGICPVWKP